MRQLKLHSLVVFSTAFAFAPSCVLAGTDLSIGLGTSSGSTTLKAQGSTLRLRDVTTFQQSIDASLPMGDAGPLSVDGFASISHASGSTHHATLNGASEGASADFDRLDAFANMKVSYRVLPITPYVGLGIGAVRDKVSVANADYKSDYFAGKAFVGAEWRSKSGFGIDVRASRLSRIN